MFLIATVWDLCATTIFPYLFEAFPEWVYLSFDKNGVAYHSNVFLDYNKYSWGWIGNSPIEITPWFGIVGAYFNYFFWYSLIKINKGK